MRFGLQKFLKKRKLRKGTEHLAEAAAGFIPSHFNDMTRSYLLIINISMNTFINMYEDLIELSGFKSFFLKS